jgi:hypothetical protein
MSCLTVCPLGREAEQVVDLLCQEKVPQRLPLLRLLELPGEFDQYQN